MINITVDNVICQLDKSELRLNLALKKLLSYRNQSVSYALYDTKKKIEKFETLVKKTKDPGKIARFEGQLRRFRFIAEKLQREAVICLYENNTFPTGLLPRVEAFFQKDGISYEIIDKREKPQLNIHKFNTLESFPPLRYYQKAAIKELKQRHRGVVVFPTAAGKTLTAAKMIQELGLNTIIVTPGKEITNLMFDVMLQFYGKGKVQKLSSNCKQIVNLKPIVIVNIQALIKLPPDLFKNYHAVFIDEFHRSAADTYQECNEKHLKNCYYKCGLTGTFFRNDNSDMAMEGVLSEALYEYPLKDAIADGFIMEPQFQMVEFKNSVHGSYQQQYKKGIVENEERNKLIATIAKKEEPNSVLVLVQQVQHGERLKKLIPEATFIHGTEKDSVRVQILEDFRNEKIKILIGTSVIGEGVDLPIAGTLIIAGGGKAKSGIIQNIGRVLRMHPKKKQALIYDFTDEGSTYLNRHSLERRDIYNTY
jgi:superfamily II DNA or RNA helicase